MPKRKLVILSLLVVVFLICSQSALTLGAEKVSRTGSIVQDCIFLHQTSSTFKVIRDNKSCAESPVLMVQHKFQNKESALPRGTLLYMRLI